MVREGLFPEFKDIGVWSKKPALGPGGWSCHSYCHEIISKQCFGKVESYSYDLDWETTRSILRQIKSSQQVLTSCNILVMRDRDANLNYRSDYYAFFYAKGDGIIWKFAASELDLPKQPEVKWM